MMDPLTAFGLAVNIITVIDFSARIAKGCYEIIDKGYTTVNKASHELATDANEAVSRLETSLSNNASNDMASSLLSLDDDQQLYKLAQRTSDVSKQLIEKLENLQVDPLSRKRKRDLLKGMYQNITSKSQIEQLETKLKSCRENLHTGLLVRLSDRSDMTIEALQKGIDKLQLDEVQQTQEFLNVNQEFRTLVEGLSLGLTSKIDELQVSLDVVNGDTQQLLKYNLEKERTETLSRFKKELYFEKMFHREETIHEAHKETCEWIFDENSETERPWSSFPQWLRLGEGSYWLAGKLGSGKSTLLNYILGKPRTKELLEDWANGKSLMILSFFFWRPGSEEQKSVHGLLRSLVYQCLDASPNLVEFIKMDSRQTVSQLWSKERLKSTLRGMITQDREPLAVCIFLDGLDEANEEDIRELLYTINEFSGLENCKICASSRPERPFEVHFKTSPKLRLENFNKDDIDRYIHSWLSLSLQAKELQVNSPGHYRHLADTLTLSAEGVFLWVVFAVRKVLIGLENNDSYQELMSIIYQMPHHMESVYSRLLDSIEERYKDDAARFFRLMYVLNESRGEEPSLYDALLVHSNTTCEELLALSPSAIELTFNKLKVHILVRCGGLLQITQGLCSKGFTYFTEGHQHYDFQHRHTCYYTHERSNTSILQHIAKKTRVDWIHRSASDFFLSSPLAVSLLEREAGSLKNGLANFCTLELENLYIHANLHVQCDVWSLCQSFHQAESQVQGALVSVFDDLMLRVEKSSKWTCDENELFFRELHEGYLSSFVWKRGQYVGYLPCSGVHVKITFTNRLFVAAIYDLFHYMTNKLHSIARDTPIVDSLLASSVLYQLFEVRQPLSRSQRLTLTLLEIGANPNAKLTSLSGIKLGLSSSISWTVWSVFLGDAVEQLFANLKFPESVEEQDSQVLDRIGAIFDMFLDFGADMNEVCFFPISIPMPDSPTLYSLGSVLSVFELISKAIERLSRPEDSLFKGTDFTIDEPENISSNIQRNIKRLTENGAKPLLKPIAIKNNPDIVIQDEEVSHLWIKSHPSMNEKFRESYSWGLEICSDCLTYHMVDWSSTDEIDKSLDNFFGFVNDVRGSCEGLPVDEIHAYLDKERLQCKAELLKEV